MLRRCVPCGTPALSLRICELTRGFPLHEHKTQAHADPAVIAKAAEGIALFQGINREDRTVLFDSMYLFDYTPGEFIMKQARDTRCQSRPVSASSDYQTFASDSPRSFLRSVDRARRA